MDEIERWAQALADRALPDESETAPDVARAFVRGGRERRRLLGGPAGDPGAFGGGLAVQLPYLLDAVMVCAASVKGFVGDPALNTVVASASLGVALRQVVASRRAHPGGTSTPPGPTPARADDTGASGDGAVGPAAPGASDDPEAVAVVLRADRSLLDLQERLSRHPATAGEAQRLAAAILELAASDPELTRRAVERLRA